MLGCQDFCGYYDWTFHYIRKEMGQPALQDFWSHGVGGEAQQHYFEAAKQGRLRGLHDVWCKTGVDEACDWTFTLDESNNVLRWDMRQCPSKGFLIANDMNADQDYCDHCMGWIVPILQRAGMSLIAHEHNHCGQCWAEMRVADAAYKSPALPIDIRNDARWNRGYIDRFQDDIKLPLFDRCSSPDPCIVLETWFSRFRHLTVLADRYPLESMKSHELNEGLLVTDETYIARGPSDVQPAGVLIGKAPKQLKALAAQFLSTEPLERPLLLHAYLPGMPFIDFGSLGLPRPVPILPQLIKSQFYRHEPHGSTPSNEVLLAMLAISLTLPVSIFGMELYRPSEESHLSASKTEVERTPLTSQQSCDLRHLAAAIRKSSQGVEISAALAKELSDYCPVDDPSNP